MARRTRSSYGIALVLVLGCNGDGGGSGSGNSATGDGSDTAGDDDPTMTDDVADDGSGDADSTDGPAGPCGNGVVDSGEACDDGDLNSDTTPDACRTDCRNAQCGDGIIDVASGEMCDDGADNANFEADACRTTCQLPICGDGGVDTGEACDDGNEAWGDSCYQCSERYYFILNAPDAGDVSILRSTRDGDPVEIVGGDPSYNGVRQLALEPLGATLYALQSAGATDRVLFFDPETGALQAEVDIGMAALGYDPEAFGFARASDGLLYVVVEGPGASRIVSVDPVAEAATEVYTHGTTFEVGDVVADAAGSIYFTTRGLGSVERFDIAGLTLTNFAALGLSNPIGMTYAAKDELFWIANNSGATEIVQADLAGTVTSFTVAAENIGPEIPSLAIDTGGVIVAPVPTQDRLVGIALLGGVQTLFDASVDSPTDIEILEMAR